jgi:hypothetical protein
VAAGLAANCLRQYFATQNVSNGSQDLWSPSTMLWPTALVLGVAVLSLIFSAIVLMAYCWGGTKAADRWSDKKQYFTTFVFVVKAGVHGVATAGMFATANNSNSLQGQTCGAPVAKPSLFPQLNFDRFCLQQVICGFLLF